MNHYPILTAFQEIARVLRPGGVVEIAEEGTQGRFPSSDPFF